jgi:hypothetical protein
MSQLVTIASTSETPGSCTPVAASQLNAMPAYANDINVTGLSSVRYLAPLHIDVLPDSALWDVIFFDGFGVPQGVGD